MKAKTFLLLCLFLGFGLTQLFAQPPAKNGTTGSVSFYWVWDGYYIDVPVNCNNDEVDRLVGNVTCHHIAHWQKLESWIWVKQHFEGEVTSDLTGEIFKVKDFIITEWPSDISTGHVNLIGDKGSHYFLTYSYDSFYDSFSFDKAVCH